jgi:hypothetical protein
VPSICGRVVKGDGLMLGMGSEFITA